MICHKLELILKQQGYLSPLLPFHKREREIFELSIKPLKYFIKFDSSSTILTSIYFLNIPLGVSLGPQVESKSSDLTHLGISTTIKWSYSPNTSCTHYYLLLSTPLYQWIILHECKSNGWSGNPATHKVMVNWLLWVSAWYYSLLDTVVNITT